MLDEISASSSWAHAFLDLTFEEQVEVPSAGTALTVRSTNANVGSFAS